MEFLQLTYFRHAARCESFSEVARAHRVPPSSVSLSVKRLEEELGVPLFERSANRLSLNENGRRFLLHVDAVFSEMDAAREELSHTEDGLSGEVRILIRANRRVVTERIAAFRLLHPSVTFSIHHRPIFEGEGYHLIVSDTPPKADYKVRFPLVEERMLLAVPSMHPLAMRRSVSLSELKDERLICMTRGSDLREFTERMLREAGVRPELAIECDDPYYIREYVRIGLGIALAPSISWKDQFPEGVVLLPLSSAHTRLTELFVTPSASRTAQAFARFASEYQA